MSVGFLEKHTGNVKQVPVKPFAQGKYGYIEAPAQYELVRTVVDPAVLYGLIQNVDDQVIYVKFGEGASTTDFDLILPSCTAELDGTSNIILLPAGCSISIYGASTAPKYCFNDFVANI